MMTVQDVLAHWFAEEMKKLKHLKVEKWLTKGCLRVCLYGDLLFIRVDFGPDRIELWRTALPGLQRTYQLEYADPDLFEQLLDAAHQLICGVLDQSEAVVQ